MRHIAVEVIRRKFNSEVDDFLGIDIRIKAFAAVPECLKYRHGTLTLNNHVLLVPAVVTNQEVCRTDVEFLLVIRVVIGFVHQYIGNRIKRMVKRADKICNHVRRIALKGYMETSVFDLAADECLSGRADFTDDFICV
ncbi:MAG: DUF3965 domain-containing protein [Ruminococcus sp.]|nr:DUF3965 domain-containing protein [Ruminococcus sp.]